MWVINDLMIFGERRMIFPSLISFEYYTDWLHFHIDKIFSHFSSYFSHPSDAMRTQVGQLCGWPLHRSSECVYSTRDPSSGFRLGHQSLPIHVLQFMCWRFEPTPDTTHIYTGTWVSTLNIRLEGKFNLMIML